MFIAHLYGSPGKKDELKAVCDRLGAVIVEDPAESLGATYKGKMTGDFGSVGICSLVGVMNVTDNLCRKIA